MNNFPSFGASLSLSICPFFFFFAPLPCRSSDQADQGADAPRIDAVEPIFPPAAAQIDDRPMDHREGDSVDNEFHKRPYEVYFSEEEDDNDVRRERGDSEGNMSLNDEGNDHQEQNHGELQESESLGTGGGEKRQDKRDEHSASRGGERSRDSDRGESRRGGEGDGHRGGRDALRSSGFGQQRHDDDEAQTIKRKYMPFHFFLFFEGDKES
jgi:hypothetical protein